MEVQVLKPFMFGGKPVPAGAIIDMPAADAAYAVALKRAERIVDAPAAAEPAPEGKPPRRRKASA